MTEIDEPRPSRTTWRPRTALDVMTQQLTAIGRFHEARHTAEVAAAAAGTTREARMDLVRECDVLRREHRALISQSHEQLELAGQPLERMATCRVVLAHRSERFLAKVADRLEDQGVRVAARLGNGADAVGAVIAEQPDLVLVEDALAMVPGEQVMRKVHEFCPDTVVTAHVAAGDRVGPPLEAGAAAVFTRRIPPLDVAQGLLELLTCEVPAIA